MESRLARQTGEVVIDQTAHITDVLPTTNAKDGSTRSSYHYEMAPWETTVIVASNSTSAFTVYLPPVSEAIGKVYTVAIVTANNTVTVDDLAGDSEDFETATLDTAHDRVAYYSNGTYWLKMSETAN